MINCIIVDDEQHAIDVITHYLKSVSQLNLLTSFTNPIEAIAFLNGHQVDLIFLDINMPKLSGIEFIRTFSNTNRHYILTTAYPQYATDGFDLDVIDFLVKPIPFGRFLQAINKAQKLFGLEQAARLIEPEETDYFIIKTQAKGKMIKINICDIDYAEGMKNYVAFHHNHTRTLALITMKEVEERLAKKHFMRIQKSFIIALNKVVAINGNQVVLKGISSEILIGKPIKSNFWTRLRKI